MLVRTNAHIHTYTHTHTRAHTHRPNVYVIDKMVREAHNYIRLGTHTHAPTHTSLTGLPSHTRTCACIHSALPMLFYNVNIY